MAHLTFGTHLKSTMNFDNGGDSLSGPVPRWQRKAREQGINLLPSASSNENSFSNRSGLSITPHNKTPLTASSFLLDASLGVQENSKSPARGSLMGKRGKSPGRSVMLSVRSKTPTRKTPTTPNVLADNSYQGDRFIPVRPTELQMDRSHHAMMKQIRIDEGVEEEEEELTQQQREHREKLVENMNDGQPLDQRVVHYSKKAPQTASHPANHKVLFSANKTSASKGTSTRHIPSVPERVLDAPELMDDYYLHLVAWSAKNHVAVALARCVYIWNAGDGTISSLAQVEPPEYICSVSWMKDGSIVAVGMSGGSIQLWDVQEKRLVRTMVGHEGRVVSLAWGNSNLASGARSGQIIHHDIRVANHAAVVFNAHNQEVCGMDWSSDCRLLASGGNDNVVNIWDGRSTTPLHTLSDHQAAVKAVAWCPWQNNLLATGGGTADRTIRVWNANAGTCVKEVLTNSQVSSIVWSSEYKELITGHGFSHNQLTIWKYPTFNKVAELTGHTGRVLELVVSPDGQMVASAAADETIRLWKCWPTIAKEKKTVRSLQPVSHIARSIR